MFQQMVGAFQNGLNEGGYLIPFEPTHPVVMQQWKSSVSELEKRMETLHESHTKQMSAVLKALESKKVQKTSTANPETTISVRDLVNGLVQKNDMEGAFTKVCFCLSLSLIFSWSRRWKLVIWICCCTWLNWYLDQKSSPPFVNRFYPNLFFSPLFSRFEPIKLLI